MRNIFWVILLSTLIACTNTSTSELENQVAEMEREIDSLEVELERMERMAEIERQRADSAAVVALVNAQMAQIAMDSAMAASKRAEIRRLEAERMAEEARKASK